MAALDRYVDALLRTPGAQSVTFSSGAVVEMIVNGAARAVGKSPVTKEQLEAALREILPADFTPTPTPRDIASGSPHGDVTITVMLSGDRLATRIVPQKSASPAPVAPPPSRSEAPRGKAKNIDELFRQMIDEGASDLHLKSGRPPFVRVHG